ncbi:hypothetical protein H9L39_09798 [Fusarium oxysporum f. sp. albedinis]|nr:hypothetical protein H9L39_09798 [Fusarium oxysporum f. sp. albedinis]
MWGEFEGSTKRVASMNAEQGTDDSRFMVGQTFRDRVTTATVDPCARISKAVSESNSSPVVVTAQLAKDCLESMPFYPELAASFIDEVTKYIQWHSTLEALKNPPETYTSFPTDILGGLKKIRSTNFSSQWEFDAAINALLHTANDGHLRVDLCSTLFSFIRNKT